MKLNDIISRFKQICESDYFINKITNEEVKRFDVLFRKYIMMNGVEIIYKNIDIYFYEDYFNFYIDADSTVSFHSFDGEWIYNKHLKFFQFKSCKIFYNTASKEIYDDIFNFISQLIT